MIRKALHHRKCSEDSGQALIETALSALFLLLFLVGIIEVGRLAYAAIEVENAARAGAAYATQSGAAGDQAGIQTAAQNDAGNLSGLTATSSTSCICSDGSSSTCSPGDCSTSHVVETVKVSTQATFDPLFHLPGLPTTYNIKGQAVQTCFQ